jgi:hypothetical protein
VSEPVRYGNWAKDREGWLFGLTGVAWTAIAVTGAPVLLAAAAHRWWWVAAGIPVWLLTVIGIAVPVRGRSAACWTADAACRGAGGAMGWTSWQSKAATGHVDDLNEADLPGVLAGVRVVDGPPYGPGLVRPAVVKNLAGRTWAVVARVSHPGIGLSEPGVRRQMALGLSELLEQAATGELVKTLAIQVRTVPDDGAERAAWASRAVRGDAPGLSVRVTQELAVALTAAGVRHEVFVTVVVPEHRIARQARQAGGGIDGRARVLYGVMGELETRLLGPVGCTDVAWLTSGDLAVAIRTGFAPGDRGGLVEAALTTGGPRGTTARLPLAAAGPGRAASPERRHYTHDAWSSVTTAVLLPDKGAVMGALAPVLTPTQAGERRSMTVFCEPIDRLRADRIVGRDAMSAGTAAQLRARMGFQTRASHHRASARVHGQDARLADGLALVRVAIVAAVTVPSTWPVADAGRRLESSVRGSGFTPLRLDLAQDSGFAAACIPLGIGLPQHRGLR